MAPPVPPISQLCLGLLTLATTELLGVQSFPSWLQVPFLQAPVNDNEESFGPEALLIQQLRSVDAIREPQRAYALHVAIANILRTDGAQSARALPHLEAARDAAVRTDDADAILAARLEVAEAYLEAGRPQDVESELESTDRLLTPDNFWISVKLDRTNGRASFELGDTQLALETFEEAARIAVQPEDVVHCACDIAKAHTCLGRAQQSLEPLRNALEVLDNSHEADSMTAAVHRSLAMEVHSRLAEAFHSLGDLASAKAHYERASQLEPKSTSLTTQSASAIKTNIGNIGVGAKPTLRCPGGARTQSFQLPTQSGAVKAFKAKISALLAASEHRKAEKELWSYLETQRRPYKSVEATTTLISLGDLYLTPEKKSYYKAGHCFLKALQASLLCCGAHSQEAKAAFRSLNYVHDMLPTKDQSEAAVVMQEFLDAADKFGISASDLGQNSPIVTV